MPRRRDDRHFGPGPYVLGLERVGTYDEFPWNLPTMERVAELELSTPVTLLAGENGVGKSTVIESLATAMGFADQGGELERSGELPPVPRAIGPVFEGQLIPVFAPLVSRTRPRNGYFLRAESFFNVASFVDGGSIHAPDVSLYGGVGLHEQSHGQSFLALAANRFAGNGLYLLDEPEAALSVTSLLALLAIVVRAAQDGAQFVIATHSPILLACPEARIYEIDDDGFTERDYDALSAVALTRAFLEAPERYLRAVLDD
ncbi:MAG: AAA family ATPase [Solirubrobacteraceae bacterium]|nr:AAA family ATPase [Solirubrobacteraceae bacterium]